MAQDDWRRHVPSERVLQELQSINALNASLLRYPIQFCPASTVAAAVRVCAPQRATYLIRIYTVMLANKAQPDHRASLYVSHALQRTAATEDGLRELGQLFGFGRSAQGRTAASDAVGNIAKEVRAQGRVPESLRECLVAALQAVEARPKGILAKQLGLQRTVAGNPGGLSLKRKLSPDDHVEIATLFEWRMAAAKSPTQACHDNQDDRNTKAQRKRGEPSRRELEIERLAAEYGVSARTIESCLVANLEERRNELQLEVVEPACGKIGPALFSGSLMGSGSAVFAVWLYALANAEKDLVELNPALVALIIGEEFDMVKAAIEFLCSPDPKKSSSERDVRRLVPLGQFQYAVLNPDHDVGVAVQY